MALVTAREDELVRREVVSRVQKRVLARQAVYYRGPVRLKRCSISVIRRILNLCRILDRQKIKTSIMPYLGSVDPFKHYSPNC